MSFEERMEQLGRRATEQEPQELSLPRCIRAAEQHKPVSCIRNYQIERHGFGEGRLPIPGIIIKDKEDASSSKDSASKQQPQHHADGEAPGNKGSARKSGKLLRPSQQQAQQQTDAIKARKSAAKAFSEALDRRNANLLQHNSKGGGGSSAPAPADENHPASPPQSSRRASLTQQPLVERHIPPRLGPDPASAAAAAPTTLGAAHAAAGSDAPCACSSVSDMPPCGSALDSPSAVSGEAAAAAVTVAEAGSAAGEGQCTAAEVARTFLTDPGSQPPSPMHAVPAASAQLTHSAAACVESAQTAADMGAAAADSQPAGGAPVRQEAVVGQHNSPIPAAAAAHSVPEGAGSHSCGSAGKHAFSSADASSRLLCFAHGASPPRLGPPARSFSPVAGGHPAQHAAGAPSCSFGGVLQRPCSPSTQRPASPVRHPGSPHWAPVPPKTQLQPPVVVRPMAEWVCEQEPLQQVPRQPRAAQEQGRPAPLTNSLRGADAAAVIRTSTAAAAAPKAEASEGGRQAGRRVSVSSASVRSTVSAGSARKQRSGAGGVVAAAFSNPELDKLVAAAAEQVAKRRLVLPALCSCGHGTSVLDPGYTRHCCSNCPLRQQGGGAAYEQLLAGLLSGMGFGG